MDEEKKCNDCGLTKRACDYPKDRSKKTGLATYCKSCSSVRSRTYYKSNSDTIKKRSSDRYAEDPERHHAKSRVWRSENRDQFLNWRRGYHRNRMDTDAAYVMNFSVRAMVNRVLNATGSDKDFSTFDRIGYTCDQLVSRLEVQFKDGMSWANYGEWEIDHKIPVSTMISRGEVRPEKINMLSNLQPLWRHENRSKGARYVG